MKGKSHTPLWLICDVSACLRLHVALGVLAFSVRRFLPKHGARPPSPEGIVWLSAWLAEALLRWVVVARQAFRLCGLDPKLARSRMMGVLLHMYDRMTVLARRWARRIRACRDARASHPSNPSILASPNPSIPDPSNSRTPNPSNPDPSNFRILKFPVAIRGPPLLAPTASYPLPIAAQSPART